MKTILKFTFLLFAVLMVFFGYGQDTLLHDSAGTVIDTITTPPPGGTGITLPLLEEWFSKGMGPVMSALVIIFGYLSKLIPWVKAQDTTLRVFAFAVLLGAGFVYFGSDVWQVAISYMSATSLYEVILKKIFPKKEFDPKDKTL